MNRLNKILFLVSTLIANGSAMASGYVDGKDDLSRYEGIQSKKTAIDAFFIAGSHIQNRPKNSDQPIFQRDEVKQVTFIADLTNYQDQDITLDWYFGKRHVEEKIFHIETANFELVTKRTLHPMWLGEWRIEISDIQQNTLLEKHFFYEK